jgi:hypothetical protein
MVHDMLWYQMGRNLRGLEAKKADGGVEAAAVGVVVMMMTMMGQKWCQLPLLQLRICTLLFSCLYVDLGYVNVVLTEFVCKKFTFAFRPPVPRLLASEIGAFVMAAIIIHEVCVA